MASLSPRTQQRLREHLPAEAAVGNPVDMIASAGPEPYAACLRELLADPGVDAVVSITVEPPLFAASDIFDALAPIAREATKPVLTVFLTGPGLMEHVASAEAPPPVFRSVEGAARALSRATRYAAWRRSEPRPAPPVETDRTAIIGELARSAGREDGYLPADATFRILELAGLPVVPWRLVGSIRELPGAGAAVGYPVVLKVDAPGVVHKSDVGGVAVDLTHEQQLVGTAEDMQRRMEASGVAADQCNWLVQAYRPGGREVILGGRRDPGCGPLVMFGLGGKYVEVFGDVKFALAPLSIDDAERMLRGIRGYKLLEGVRGEAPVDLELARDTLLRLSALLAEHDSIAELDINPLMLAPERSSCVLVDARIRVGVPSGRPPTA